MLGVLPQPPRVCEACTPPLSHHPFVGPHTESLSWHHSPAYAKCPLHVHQQVPHRDIFPFIQHTGPFARVPPWRLAKMWGCILASSNCSRKASTLKRQSVYVTSTPGSVDLKISISSLTGASCFLSLPPLQPLHLCWQPTVSLTVEYPSESGAPLSGEEGVNPICSCSALVPWWPSVRESCPSMGYGSCLGPLPHPRGSPILLRCTAHQLAR